MESLMMNGGTETIVGIECSGTTGIFECSGTTGIFECRHTSADLWKAQSYRYDLEMRRTFHFQHPSRWFTEITEFLRLRQLFALEIPDHLWKVVIR